MDNKGNSFTEDQLRAKSIDELEKLAALAQVEPDFSLKGNNGERPSDNSVPKPRRLGEKKAA